MWNRAKFRQHRLLPRSLPRVTIFPVPASLLATRQVLQQHGTGSTPCYAVSELLQELGPGLEWKASLKQNLTALLLKLVLRK